MKTIVETESARSPRLGLLGLGAALVLALTFFTQAALPYFSSPGYELIYYAGSRRAWLLVHIAAGTVALLGGPFQYWIGLTRRLPRLHRALGGVYVGAVAVGSVAALPLLGS